MRKRRRSVEVFMNNITVNINKILDEGSNILLEPAKEENGIKNKVLNNCNCGGNVEIVSRGYGYDTYDIVCKKCGGKWHMNTYSSAEAINRWNSSH